MARSMGIKERIWLRISSGIEFMKSAPSITCWILRWGFNIRRCQRLRFPRLFAMVTMIRFYFVYTKFIKVFCIDDIVGMKNFVEMEKVFKCLKINKFCEEESFYNSEDS